jgi:2,4-dienoyl-CoA reductase-like NADH-dependent reductase (Old Yellow Enzyme family)/thioredoxin reductase
MLDMLFQPIKIGNVELKNRLAVPPMVSNFCTDDGQVTERLIRFHEERAKGGWGLITIEQTVVTKSGKGHPNQPTIWSDENIEGLSRLTQRVHAAGAKISVQLNHAGRSSNVSITGCPLQAPSVLKDPQRTDMPVELTIEEIHEIVRQFGEAALRAKKAGFDMVTEHAHARYLIASFLSPISNKRTDEYGGSLINRARFAVEVLKSMREKAGPDFPIIYRFSADEFVEGGLTLGDTLAFAQIIEEAGADALDVSVGNAFSTQYITAPSVVPHAFIADIAAQFKKAVAIPVAVAGRINDPFIAESILKLGKADLICMGRTSIADPYFPNKVRERRFDDITYCIGCLQGCIDNVRVLKPICCLVNPCAGREEELKTVRDKSARKIIVIGGGIAGMEAAIVAARRGCDVSVYEKGDKLGGQWLLAAISPGKTEYNTFTIWQKNQLKELGIKVYLNTEATAGMIAGQKPDAVIVSTGALPVTPKIKGIDCKNVMQAFDVLGGMDIPGKRVAIVGGGLVGCETALHLAISGTKVFIIEMLDEIMQDGIPTSNYFLLKHLEKYNVEMITSAKVREIRESSIAYDQNGESCEIAGIDNTIIAVGAKPNDTISEELKKMTKVVVIGDALKARKALDAVYEGYLAGLNI